MLDFPSDKLPALFTDNPWANDPKKQIPPSPDSVKKIQQMMYMYIEAGVVEPKLLPVGKGDDRGKEDGITVEDLFRNPNLGSKLFNEIVFHSIGREGGLGNLFFSIRKKLGLLTLFQSGMVKDLAISSLRAKT